MILIFTDIVKHKKYYCSIKQVRKTGRTKKDPRNREEKRSLGQRRAGQAYGKTQAELASAKGNCPGLSKAGWRPKKNATGELQRDYTTPGDRIVSVEGHLLLRFEEIIAQQQRHQKHTRCIVVVYLR